MKKQSLVVGALTMALCFGSVTQTMAEDNHKKDMITVAWPESISTLSPYQSPGLSFEATGDEVYEGLGVYDSEFVFHKVMAKDITQLDTDGYEFEITIYDYIHDHEGNPITADDVIFSFETLKAAGTASQHLSKIDVIEKSGDYSVIIKLTDNGYGVLEQALWKTRIVSQKAFEETGDEMATHAVGTGPYKVTDFMSGSYLVTEAVDDYWQTDEALRGPYAMQNVDVIKKIICTENSQKEASLESGTVDLVYNIDSSSTFQFEGNSDIVSYSYNSNNPYSLFASADGPLQDEKLRKAVWYALDAQGIVDGAWDGFGELTTHALWYTSDYNTEWEKEDYFSYDPDYARELVKEAGAEGTHIRILSNEGYSTVSEFIQFYLNDVGFDAEIINEEPAAYLKDFLDPTAYDLCIREVGLATTIQMWRFIYDQANYNGKTYGGFVDDNLQTMLMNTCIPKNHTEENMNELFNYLLDKAYTYTFAVKKQVNMWRTDSGIKEVVRNSQSAPMCNCFIYE